MVCLASFYCVVFYVQTHPDSLRSPFITAGCYHSAVTLQPDWLPKLSPLFVTKSPKVVAPMAWRQEICAQEPIQEQDTPWLYNLE